MAKLTIAKGSTDVTVYIFIQDSTATNGAGLTGLVFNSAGLTCYYTRPLAASTQLTLATQTVTGAHNDGGFVEVDAVNQPGIYRLDLSDAICAVGVNSVSMMLRGATNMAPLPLEIQLTNFDLNDASPQVTILDISADAITASAIATNAIGAAELAADAINEIRDAILSDSTPFAGANIDAAISTRSTPAQVNTEVQNVVVANHLDHLLAVDYDPASKPGVATALLNELVEDDGGVSRYTANALEQAPVGSDPWSTALPGAYGAGEAGNILGNNLDAAITTRSSHTANNVRDAVTGGAYALDTDANGRVRVVDGVGAGELDTSSGQVIVATNNDKTGYSVDTVNDKTGYALSAAGIQAIWDALTSALVTVGSIGRLLVDNINATISSRSSHSAADSADAVWEEQIGDHSSTVGSTAEALAAAGGSGDPWVTPLPGAYAAGTAGNILGNNLDVPTSDAATPTEVNTEVDNALADIHLDHLLAVDYDPASKPGVATALLNELVEDDGGVSRYTANALEQAPTGGGDPWSTALPGAYGAGEAGNILGNNLDAQVSTRADQTTVNDISNRLPAALVSGLMAANVDAIDGSTIAAERLRQSASTIVHGTAQTGTLTTTQMSSNLTEATPDHYIGRLVVWISGALTDQYTDITDYDGAGLLTFTTITEAPSNGDEFLIV